jgi:hypothetical protein
MPTVEVGAACAIAVGEAWTAFNAPNALASDPCETVLPGPPANTAPMPRFEWIVPREVVLCPVAREVPAVVEL